MGGSVNKVILVGNLGADPEMKQTPSGLTIANLRVATSEVWTDKNTGQKQERTEWHRVVVYDKLAGICERFLSKGQLVYIEGRLQTRRWDDKEGQKHTSVEIVANEMMMLGDRRDTTNNQQDTDALPAENGPVAEDEFPF